MSLINNDFSQLVPIALTVVSSKEPETSGKSNTYVKPRLIVVDSV